MKDDTIKTVLQFGHFISFMIYLLIYIINNTLDI